MQPITWDSCAESSDSGKSSSCNKKNKKLKPIIHRDQLNDSHKSV